MTESEWLASTDPGPMLKFLGDGVSPRKLRLFACACCRLCWEEFSDARSRAAVTIAELYADGRATVEELRSFRQRAAQVMRGVSCDGAAYAAALENDPEDAYAFVLPQSGRARLAALLREVAGNPFHASHPLPVAVLNWNQGTVKRLAEGVYDDRRLPEGTLDPARLSILADALLDAGAEDDTLLEHLRSPGPHVRGCHAVDLILGRS